MTINVDFDPLVRFFFQQAGWNPVYRYDISAWSEALTDAGYVLWDEARLLLSHIGGVSIETRPYCDTPFWVEDGDERYEAIIEFGRTPGPLIFNPLHPMALAHRKDLYRLKTLQENNWKIVPIGSFSYIRYPRVESVLFLVSTGEIIQWSIWPKPLDFWVVPIGRTFSDAMRNIFHYEAWFRGVMP